MNFDKKPVILAFFFALAAATAMAQEPGQAEGPGGADEPKKLRFAVADKSEEARILDLLSKVPMPPAMRKDLESSSRTTATNEESKPSFDEDPAAHLAATPEEREKLQKQLAAMSEEERAKFLTQKRAELDAKEAEERRKRQLEGRDFASEGVAPKDSELSEEELRRKLEEARAKHEAEAQAREARRAGISQFMQARRQAVADLKAFGQKATPYVAKAFETADDETGWILAEIAVAVPDDDRAHAALMKWLDKQAFQARIIDDSGLRHLSQVRTADMVDALERAIYRANWKNRVALAGTMFGARSPANADKVGKAMLKFLKDGDEQSKPAAINFLALMLPEEGMPDSTKWEIISEFRTLIRSPEYKNIRVTMTAALGRSGHPAVAEELRSLLSLSDGQVVLQAVKSLGAIGQPAIEASRDLARFLAKSYPVVLRKEAAQALGNMKDESVVWDLIDMLFEPDLKVEIKQVVASSLNRITGKNLGMNGPRWSSWWENELKSRQEQR